MRVFYLFLFCLAIVSCGEDNKTNKKVYLPASNGNLNTISVVAENALWNGAIGEEIRYIFAAPIAGLTVDEPLFKLRQIPPQVFDGFATRSRLVLKIEKGTTTSTTSKIVNDAFAKPQTVAVIGGKTNKEIIEQLQENKAKIIAAFNKEEVKEKQRRINLSLLKDEAMEKALGFNINIPSAYRIAKADKRFYWIRKNLNSSKNMALMFYEIPIENISKGDSTIVDIVKVRDSITKTQVPGQDGIYMKAVEAYAPSLYKTIIDNKPAYEIRGVWDLEGYTGGGPFLTYFIEDEVNKRYLVADGYVYAPSLDKSEYVFELESIIKSIEIK